MIERAALCARLITHGKEVGGNGEAESEPETARGGTEESQARARRTTARELAPGPAQPAEHVLIGSHAHVATQEVRRWQGDASGGAQSGPSEPGLAGVHPGGICARIGRFAVGA